MKPEGLTEVIAENRALARGLPMDAGQLVQIRIKRRATEAYSRIFVDELKAKVRRLCAKAMDYERLGVRELAQNASNGSLEP